MQSLNSRSAFADALRFCDDRGSGNGAPLVTSKVTGPDATLIWLGVQPESTSVTATFLEPLAPLELEPQPATASAPIAQPVTTAAPDRTFIFN